MQASHPIHRQAGTSMVEVLISLLVMAFGLLGAAALQLASIRASQHAAESSVATVQLYSILDTIRANADVGKIGEYDLPMSPGCPAPSGNSLALRDLAKWLADVKESLGASACGAVQCSGGGCTAYIQWSGNSSEGTERPPMFVSTML